MTGDKMSYPINTYPLKPGKPLHEAEKEAFDKWQEGQIEADKSELVKVLAVGGIDMKDSPDFVDAYIQEAEWIETGEALTEDELDAINEDSDFVYEAVINQIY